MKRCNRERSRPQLPHPARNITIEWFKEWQLSDGNFYPHFPNASNGEPQFICFIGNLRFAPPHSNALVGQTTTTSTAYPAKVYSVPPSKAVKISSGKGALKSSGTMKLPWSCPRQLRRFDEERNSTNFAIGTPRLEIIISSPSSTGNKSRERFVLA